MSTVKGGRNRFRAVKAVIAISGLVTGCSWHGINAMPLPGTQGSAGEAFEIQAQIPDVGYLQTNSRVRVGDVNVGTVTKIERQDWHALITMTINGDVDLPENATVTLGQTSLLGSLHIELASPSTTKPVGELRSGDLIPLQSAGAYPTTDQTLTALSLLLNGGGIGHVQDITAAFAIAFTGREQDLKSLITQIDQFVGKLDAQTGDIIAATESFNGLVSQFADQKSVLDNAIRTIPDALEVLSSERENLVEALDAFGKFSALATDTVNNSKENLVKELNDIAPVLQSLANSGPALTRSLDLLSTFPWNKAGIEKFVRGDAANLTAIIDLTLSRIDNAMLTGTRFEGELTELEMQWGRTIGQVPSPYTAINPLVAPYRFDQGR